MNCDANSLIQSAQCLRCIPRGMLREVWTYLLCKVANQGLSTKCSDLQVTYTGKWLGPVQWDVGCDIGIAGVQINGSDPVNQPAGLWLKSSFVYNETGAPLGGLTTLSFPNLVGVVLGSLSPSTLPALTSLSYPALQYVDVNFSPTTMAALTTLSVPLLAYVGGNFSPSTMGVLTTLSLPSLTYVGGVFGAGTMAALTSLSAPQLAYVGGNFSPGTMALLTSLSLPILSYVGGNFNLGPMASLASVSLPSLKYLGVSISLSSMAALTSFSAPAMVNYAGTNITMNSANGNIASVVLGTVGTLKSMVTTINISGQKLDAASVNGILALLVSLDGNNGTTLWGAGKTLTINGGTNAAPSGQGVADKATLQGRGATVTTN